MVVLPGPFRQFAQQVVGAFDRHFGVGREFGKQHHFGIPQFTGARADRHLLERVGLILHENVVLIAVAHHRLARQAPCVCAVGHDQRFDVHAGQQFLAVVIQSGMDQDRLLVALERLVHGAAHGRVLAHRRLLREVWGPSHADQSHYLRIYMGHLRQKLESDPAQPQHLLTETAVGYRLVVL